MGYIVGGIVGMFVAGFLIHTLGMGNTAWGAIIGVGAGGGVAYAIGKAISGRW